MEPCVWGSFENLGQKNMVIVATFGKDVAMIGQCLSFSFYFFTFSNNNQHQNIFTFSIFYITSIIFYYYSNKKIYHNTKLFHFFIQILFTLYHIITFY
jgi:hypothetical protein